MPSRIIRRKFVCLAAVCLTAAIHAQTSATSSGQKKEKSTFSYITFDDLTMKNGKGYKTGSDQPYTGYILSTPEETKEFAKMDPDNAMIFTRIKNGDFSHTSTWLIHYVPSTSTFWEWNQETHVIAFYEQKDKEKIQITRDNFLEMKEKKFYLKWRIRKPEDDQTIRLDIFDKNQKTVFSVRRNHDSIIYKMTGRDGILRELTFNTEKGRMDGYAAAYHPNGKKFYETTYTDGHPGSIVELYDKNGKKIFRLYFETHLTESQSHTSNLILVEEWDEEKKMFVKRDNEHFTLFYAFSNPLSFLFSDEVKAEISKMQIQHIEAIKNAFTEKDVKDKELLDGLQELIDSYEKDLREL